MPGRRMISRKTYSIICSTCLWSKSSMDGFFARACARSTTIPLPCPFMNKT
jgi:hypothetical protein